MARRERTASLHRGGSSTAQNQKDRPHMARRRGFKQNPEIAPSAIVGMIVGNPRSPAKVFDRTPPLRARSRGSPSYAAASATSTSIAESGSSPLVSIAVTSLLSSSLRCISGGTSMSSGSNYRNDNQVVHVLCIFEYYQIRLVYNSCASWYISVTRSRN